MQNKIIKIPLKTNFHSRKLLHIIQDSEEKHRTMVMSQSHREFKHYLQTDRSANFGTPQSKSQKQLLNTTSTTFDQLKSKRSQKIDTLNNIVELQNLMNMYEDTKKLCMGLGDYSRLSILFQLWEKLCEDEGRLQVYIKYLYKEMSPFIISDDQDLIQIIQSLQLKYNNKVLSMKNLSHSEVSELLKKEIQLIQKKEKEGYDRYTSEMKNLLADLKSKEINYEETIQRLTKQLIQITTQQEEYEFQTNKKLKLRESECINFVQQIQDLNETLKKNTILWENEKQDLKQQFIQQSQDNYKQLLKQQRKNDILSQKIVEYQQLLEAYKNKFQIAFYTTSRMANEQLKLSKRTVQNQEAEIRRLQIRAACQFSELTPRPNLQQFIENFKLKTSLFTEKTSKESFDILLQHLMEDRKKLKHAFQKKINDLLPDKSQKLVKKNTIEIRQSSRTQHEETKQEQKKQKKQQALKEESFQNSSSSITSKEVSESESQKDSEDLLLFNLKSNEDSVSPLRVSDDGSFFKDGASFGNPSRKPPDNIEVYRRGTIKFE